MAESLEFKPFWLNEKDWLVTLALTEEIDYVGRLFAFAQLTDTRMLALIGDPSGPVFELLLSFSSEANKQLFLKLVRSDGYCNPDEENAFMLPEQSEIEEARPLGMVFPAKAFERILSVAEITLIMQAPVRRAKLQLVSRPSSQSVKS